MNRCTIILSSCLMAVFSSLTSAAPLGTAFTYQGSLNDGGTPVDGLTDFRFSLWDAPTLGTQIGATLEFSTAGVAIGPPISVVGSLFTIDLPFGVTPFDGQDVYLQIEVDVPSGGGSWTTLSPRQRIAPTPYALQTRGLYVDPALNVGIGTTTPANPLHVESDDTYAVYAQNTAISTTGTAVFGRTDSTSGTGVAGVAVSPTGTTIGVHALTNSPDGFAIFSSGPPGSKNYFERNVGIGTTSPVSPLHVDGGQNPYARVILAIAQNDIGTALEADSLGSESRAIYATAGTNSGVSQAVWGENSSPNGYAAYFTGASGSKNYFERPVGIGTASPDATLHVEGGTEVTPTGGGILIVEASNGNQLAFDGSEVQARNGGNAIDLQINPGGGNVGIGTASPEATLHVEGGTEEMPAGGGIYKVETGNGNQLAFDGSEVQARNGGNAIDLQINPGGGNVGIGTTNPNHELVVQGDDPAVQIRDDTTNNSADAARLELLERAGGAFDGGAFLWWNGETNKLLVGTKENGVNTNVLVVDRATSSVGIGTQNPGNYRLAVNGPVRAKEVVVETGWSDFVFEPDYELRSLEQIEAHIREHGHLPDIPSAEEVAKNGVKVGEMESKLLQKVEELTLHLIDLNKRIESLEEENAQLRGGWNQQSSKDWRVD